MLHRYDYSFRSLGTLCSITVFHENEDNIDTIVRSACAQIVYFEGLFSRFRPDSMLSKLNCDKVANMNEDFVDLLLCARKIYKQTGWFFNPLSDIRTLGYIKNFDDSESFSLCDIVEDLDMNAIMIEWTKIVLRPNMNLDFWAIGKGYIADRISIFLESRGYHNFIVNLGGDIVTRWVSTNNVPPRVGIMSPSLSGFVGSLSIENASISTSGTYVRHWSIADRPYHHIKTPGSANQIDSLASVTIVAPYGYESDALATAAFAMWPEKWLRFCEDNSIDAFCIKNDGTVCHTLHFNTKYALEI